jgi:hypothetical protein
MPLAVTRRPVMLPHAMPRRVTLPRVMRRPVMLPHATPLHAMLRHKFGI